MSIFTFFAKLVNAAGTFIKNEVTKIPGDVQAVETALESASTVANNAVNALKDFANSPAGKTIEGVLTVAVPGGWLAGILAALPKLIIGLGHAQEEFTKSPEQVVIDGLKNIIGKADPNITATDWIALQSHLNVNVAAQQGVQLPIQVAAAAAPAIYAGLPVDPAPAIVG